MSKSKVAVIIPCYNASKYIRKTLDSVLNQNYKDLEIVAIDDGSTDETKKILESYVPKIRVLSHPNNANLGQAASLNLGINETGSDLIAFLDSDDIWYPNKIKKQVGIFERHSDVGLVYTNGYVIDENDAILFKMLPDDFREDNIPGKMLLKCYIKSPSMVVVRRKILEQTGLFKTNLHSLDHDMWIRMSEVTKFYYLCEYLTAYRKHGGQKSLKRQQWEDGFNILEEACNRYPYGVGLKLKRLAVLYYRLGEYDRTHHYYFRSIRNYFLSIILDPFRAINVILNEIKSS
jgi:glycosyltransferase involved in cell wall biosynthesis